MNLNPLSSVTAGVSVDHQPAFMINFIISYKCNLACSYCESHDNSEEPISLETCKKSVDFIFQYADIILSAKRKHERRVALNLIGGEPFMHPNVVEILEYINNTYKEKYSDRWKMSVCVTTNGLIGANALEKAIDLIDYWTVSYHTESLQKQKELTLTAIKAIHASTQHLEVRVMAPSEPEKFLEAKNVHSQLIDLGVNALMKPIHSDQYSSGQTGYLKIFWKTKDKEQISNYDISKGITCCANKPLLIDNDRSNKTNFIPDNNFHTWNCALNWDFLFVNHLSEVYHNATCRVSYLTGKEEPIGTIDNAELILNTLQQQINDKAVPVIKCPKSLCYGCGMCATKAKTKEDLDTVMKMQLTDVSVLKYAD